MPSNKSIKLAFIYIMKKFNLTLKITSLLTLVLIVASCQDEKIEQSLADKIESAHNMENFKKHEAIQFNISVNFGSKTAINGIMTLSTDSKNGLIQNADGSKIYFNGDKVFYDTAQIKDNSNLRFKAYTWSYFFLLPFKLNDEGTVWQDYENKNLNGKEFLVEELTFKSEIGDTPDDWYIVYADTASHLLQLAAYIVTDNKTIEEAEKDPHAIEYYNYVELEGVSFATKWAFWEWRKNIGTIKQLGEGTLTSFKFIDDLDGIFTVPSHYVQVED
jgi:hypothetical protein